jgi:chorismate-pyruvate lyase
MAALAAALAAPAYAQPDAAHAHLAAFERDLDGHASATAVLQAWCDAHGPAPGARIVARLAHEAKAPTAMATRALNVGPDAVVRYRRVDLMCGDIVLSRADNWYLPAKLSPAMNQALDQTQTPFGAAVAALDFTRRNLQTEVLLDETPSADAVLRHAAVLLTASGEPFSFVVETYTRAVLAY